MGKFLLDVNQDEHTFNVSGLRVNVRGLSSLSFTKDVKPDVVFLLHGRTSNAEALRDLGSAIMAANPGILVVAFDHRNHGHRISFPDANLTWADGNAMHG